MAVVDGLAARRCWIVSDGRAFSCIGMCECVCILFFLLTYFSFSNALLRRLDMAEYKRSYAKLLKCISSIGKIPWQLSFLPEVNSAQNGAEWVTERVNKK